MIEQPTGCCNQNIDASVNQLVLLFEAHAANQQSFGQFAEFRIGVEVFSNLRGQFAGRAKNQTAGHARACAATSQQGDHGQSKTGRLAGSGLCDAQDIFAFECRRNGSSLNGGRGIIARIGNGFKDFSVQI